jgi:formate hydrogenlyase subunit 3/multisubunit Na+/H+ antiporter MnhD subunit
MTYLLLIFFPVVMAASCFVLRKQTRLVILAAVATMLVQIALVVSLPLDQPVLMLGLNLALDPLSRLFLLTFLLAGVLIFLATWNVPHGEQFVPITLMILGLIGTTLLLLQKQAVKPPLFQEHYTASLLLGSTGLLAVLAIVDLPTGSSALVQRTTLATALKYLVLMLIAGVIMYMAFVLFSIYQPGVTPGRPSPAHLILAMIVVGFGLRLAIVPFHSWLPDLAEDAAPMTTVLIVAVVHAVTLLFLIASIQFFFYPDVIGGAENARGTLLLLAISVVTALLGGLLALAQASMRRTIGYLVVYNAGMILFGLMTLDSIGVAGALFETLNQMIIALLLFLSIGLLERPDGRPQNVVRRDLLWRWPIAGTGLLCGGMALLGLPPFSFVGKLLLYQAAARRGGPYLALLLLATALALLALLRLARERLLGPAEDVAGVSPLLLGGIDLDRPADRRLEPEPRGMVVLTLVLLAICLGIGLYPQPLLATINEAIRGLTFIQPL